jgi:tripartite-type tricarboxylate transporter receptor subunit TctC
MRRLNPIPRLAVVQLALLSAAAPASAQGVERFYAGKTVTITVGFGPGGAYDYYARHLARHMGKHIPGKPTIVAQNMPGAGSLTAANYLYSIAPKDGTAFGSLTQTLAIEQAVGNPGAKFKVTEFNWIGRATDVTEVQLTMAGSKVKTIDDAKALVTSAASTGAGSPTEGYPKLMNGTIGTRFKPVGPYKNSIEGLLALERGEVDTALTSFTSIKQRRPDWIRDKKVNVLVQYAVKRIADLPDVPTLVELGKTQEDRQMLGLYVSSEEVGRAFTAPPGIPADRVAALRAAFMATLRDPEALAEATKARADVNPMSGADLQAFIRQATDVSPAVIERLRTLLR